MSNSWRIQRMNPLLHGLNDEGGLRIEPVYIMDGEYIFLPGNTGGVAKISTYRGGVVIAEKEYLPAECGAAQVEHEAPIRSDAELQCGIVCHLEKIIRHHLHRWLGLRSDRA